MTVPTNRRQFLKRVGTAALAFHIVPRYVLGRGYVAPSDEIVLGFIGLGKQVGGLRQQFLKQPGTRVLACCDVYKAKVETFAQAVNTHYATTDRKTECLRYANYRELLDNKDINAVVIATPDHWHGVMVERAAKAGKDIYCEKPLALTIEEGRDMVRAVQRNKRVFQTGSMQRSWNEFRQAVALVRSGAIGAVKNVVVNVGGPPRDFDFTQEALPEGLDWQAWLGPNVVERPYNAQLNPPLTATFWGQWRAVRDFGGGGMTDWGAHMFDIAQWGLGMDESGPVAVDVSGPGQQQGATYRYANGVEMKHVTDTKEQQYCHFFGEKGEVKVGRGKLITTPESLKNELATPARQRSVGLYVSENHYANFLDAIRSRQQTVCDVETGHRTASVCTIGNIAYQLGRPLRWNPEQERFDGDKDANRLLSRPMRKA